MTWSSLSVSQTLGGMPGGTFQSHNTSTHTVVHSHCACGHHPSPDQPWVHHGGYLQIQTAMENRDLVPRMLLSGDKCMHVRVLYILYYY